MQPSRALSVGALLVLGLLAWSGWQPFDRATWLLEVAPVLGVLPLLWFTRRSHPFTPLLYWLVLAHCVVLIIGGAYTYARVPLGFAVQDVLHLARNPYDRIGHFMQGFVPAMAAREILLRGKHVRPGRMLAFLSLCVVMTVSSCYELIEWLVAVLIGQGADEFLGTQGDVWDTQWDMFMALIGGSTSLLLLSHRQDRQLRG